MSAFRPRTFRLQIVILMVAGVTLTAGLVGASGAPASAWVTVGSTPELERDGVLFNEEHGVYLVDTARGPVALSAFGPWNNERVTYCESSKLFEAARSGSKFDSRGYYLAGPAPRALSRHPVRVVYPQVQIQPNELVAGVGRAVSRRRAHEPAGRYCDPY